MSRHPFILERGVMTREPDGGGSRILSLPRLLTEEEVPRRSAARRKRLSASDSAGASVIPVSVAAASAIQRIRLLPT